MRCNGCAARTVSQTSGVSRRARKLIEANPIGSAIRRHVSIFLAILISLCSWQCITEPAEPVPPSWDVPLTIPILDTTRTIHDLVEKDTSILRFDATTHLISYTFTEAAASDSIGDRIFLSPEGSRFAVTVGPLKVRGASVSDSIALFPPGTYPFFPAATVRIGARQLTVPEFSSLSIDSGTAELVIRNSLPVPIEFPEPITLTDGLGRIVASFPTIAGEIPPGGVRSSSDDLTGRETNNSVRISTTASRDSITVRSPRDTTDVVFTADSRIAFEVRLRDLKVTRATARIPQQEILRRDSSLFVVDDSTLVQSVFFKSGSFSIVVVNDLGVGVGARLRLPQLIHLSNNAPFDRTLTIEARRTAEVPFNMSQYKIFSPTPTGSVVYSLEIIQLESSGDELTTISQTDSVVASVNVAAGTKFIVRSASAVIKPTLLNINHGLGVKLGELPEIFSVDSIQLPDARLTLSLTAPGPPARVSDFRILARKDTVVRSIQFRDNRSVNIPGDPIVFDHPSSTLIDVLNQFVARAKALPDSFTILGKAVLNPDYNPLGTPASVADTSKIQGNFVVDFPLNIGIKNGTVRDTLKVEEGIRISQDDIDRINEGNLVIQVLNSIPASLKLSFKMLNATKDTVLGIYPRTDSIFVRAANVGADRFSSDSVRSEVHLRVARQDIRNFVNAKFIEAVVNLNTTPSAATAKFRTTDSIRMRIHGTLNYRVDPKR